MMNKTEDYKISAVKYKISVSSRIKSVYLLFP